MVLPDWSEPTAAVAGVVLVVSLLVQLVALGVIPGNRKPSTGMAWLLLMLAIPIVGFLIFLVLGRTNVGRHRLTRQREAQAAIATGTAAIPEFDPAGFPAYLRSIVRLNRHLGSLPMSAGNRVEVIEGYVDSISAMTAAVATAAEFVHVEFYILAWDEVTAPLFDALIAATERGVAVRVLYDHLGSRSIPGYRQLKRRLAATRIEWHPMLPLDPLRGHVRRPDLRNHRKLLVVDDRVGFMGSQNLVEPGYDKPRNHRAGREWVELMVRVEGPAVAALDAVFATDWYVETHRVHTVTIHPASGGPEAADVHAQVVPSGPGYVAENNLRLFNTLIYSAQERVSLTSPYFVPDESLLSAVTTAAQRGIDIELFVSEQADQFMVGHAQASYYRALLEAGVRIHLYPAPYVLHAKHLTIDTDVAVIGSSNMDLRSFALNYELMLLVVGTEHVAPFRAVEDHYRAISRELTLAEWRQRPRLKRYVDNVMRLTAALQ